VSLSGLALLAVPLDPGLLTRCTTPSSTGYERQAGRRSRCRALPASARYDGLTADCARLPGAFAGPEGLPAIGRSTPLANSARTVARSVRSDVSDPPETAKAGLSMRRLDAINSRVRLIMTSLVRTRSWDWGAPQSAAHREELRVTLARYSTGLRIPSAECGAWVL
jgi:hypothetical protein